MVRIVTVQIQGNVEWKCFRASSGHWVGVCAPLKLTVQADTWAELMEDISHTLDMMFKDLLESQELERFLRDHGWTLAGVIPHTSRNVRFDVPFDPVRVANGPKECVYQ